MINSPSCNGIRKITFFDALKSEKLFSVLTNPAKLKSTHVLLNLRFCLGILLVIQASAAPPLLPPRTTTAPAKATITATIARTEGKSVVQRSLDLRLVALEVSMNFCKLSHIILENKITAKYSHILSVHK